MSVDKISRAELRLRGGMLAGETRPVLGLLVLLAGLPLVLQGYVVYILPQYMTFGIAAMSLGLLWGRAGILSFGQAAFFALTVNLLMVVAAVVSIMATIPKSPRVQPEPIGISPGRAASSRF